MGKYISNDDFLSRIKSLVGNEYTFLEKYRGALTKILCQHNSCGLRWNIRPNDFYNGHRCPNCSKRKIKSNKDFGKEIQNLVNKEYLFLEEYKGRNIKIKCRHKYNLIIEYNGVQHYKETNFFKVSLKEQQRIDLHKRNMAENHNIKYLIIPYTNYDNLEELLINKLFLEVK